MGTTRACFQSMVTTPVSSESWKNLVRIWASLSVATFRMKAGMESGPVAFMFFNSFRILIHCLWCVSLLGKSRWACWACLTCLQQRKPTWTVRLVLSLSSLCRFERSSLCSSTEQRLQIPVQYFSQRPRTSSCCLCEYHWLPHTSMGWSHEKFCFLYLVSCIFSLFSCRFFLSFCWHAVFCR